MLQEGHALCARKVRCHYGIDPRRESCTHPLVDLLRLLRLLGHSPLPSLLRRLRPRFRIQQRIPPPETTRVIANEPFMMHIMMVGTCPKRQEMVQTPRELIPAVRIDGLEKSAHDPDVHGQDMQIAGDGAPKDRGADGAETEDHDFDWGGVFGSHAEGGRVLVVDLVDVFVERAPVKGAVRPVVPCVFEDEEDGYLVSYFEDWRQGDAGGEAEVLGQRVEEPVFDVSCRLLE